MLIREISTALLEMSHKSKILSVNSVTPCTHSQPWHICKILYQIFWRILFFVSGLYWKHTIQFELRKSCLKSLKVWSFFPSIYNWIISDSDLTLKKKLTLLLSSYQILISSNANELDMGTGHRLMKLNISKEFCRMYGDFKQGLSFLRYSLAYSN